MKNILVFEINDERILSRERSPGEDFYFLKKQIPNQDFKLIISHEGLEKYLKRNLEKINGIIYNNGYGDFATALENEFYQDGINKIKEIYKKFNLPIFVVQSPMIDNPNEKEYELLRQQGIIKDYSTAFGEIGKFNSKIKEFIKSLK